MVLYRSKVYYQSKAMNGIGQTPELFDRAKRDLFSRLALRNKNVVRVHKNQLWGKKEDNKRDWGNVSEHCLIVAARCVMLAEQIWLSWEIIRDLEKAWLLHDAFKKSEVMMTKQEKSWNKFDEAWRKEDELMQEYWDISENVRFLRSGSGHSSLKKTQEILTKAEAQELSDLEKAFLILHYVDDYTINDTWVESWVDQLKDRVEHNEKNPNYHQLDEDGRMHFDGRTTFDIQLEVGRGVEEYLMKQYVVDIPKNAIEIPHIVDEGIRNKIQAIVEWTESS